MDQDKYESIKTQGMNRGTAIWKRKEWLIFWRAYLSACTLVEPVIQQQNPCLSMNIMGKMCPHFYYEVRAIGICRSWLL